MSSGEPFNHPAVKELNKRFLTLWALDHAENLMSWDLETYMPSEGIRDRSVAFAEISALAQRLVKSPEIERLLREAEKDIDSLNDYERGVVRVVSRRLRIAKAIPEELTRREAEVTSRATVVWREAKKRSDFSMFKPYLEEIVEIAREKAEHLGYEGHPYNALLDLYEEGLTIDDVERVFNPLVPATKRILEKVMSEGFYPSSHPLEDVEYNVDAARRLIRSILDRLEWPWSRGRVDESAHPFTIDMGVNDVRITVRYEGRDIKRAMYSLIHEYGHALYELQVDPRIARTPIGGGVSMGIHEGQSRFWENIVGRGPWATRMLKELLDEHMGFTRSYSVLELYRYFNTVKPSLIRVDADELTYNLHIYLRFDIEKRLVEGSLSVDEAPQYWDDMMEKLLGVRPSNAAEGILQDIHWSHGSIGYFPTYTLGNVVAATMWDRLGGPASQQLRSMRLGELREWLREKIHRWGSTYAPKELLSRSLGASLEADPLVRYLEWKYTRLPQEGLEEYLGS